MSIALSHKDLLCKEGDLELVDTPPLQVFCKICSSTFSVFTDTALIWTIPVDEETKVRELDYGYFSVSRDSEEKRFLCASVADCKRWVTTFSSLSTPRLNVSMDDFDILSVLGRGFLGKVLLCRRKETSALYAIKTVHKKKLANTGYPQSIVTERNILMMAKHPFIVQLHFAFQTAHKCYLGMEYAPGGDLFYFLEAFGNVKTSDARLYIAEISIALHHLHEMDVIYRDLKPENIMFDAQGHVKLTDFGLAVDLSDKDFHAAEFCGTVQYLAPEVLTRRKYSPASDFWALGCVIVEMLTGLVAFECDSQEELLEAIIKEPPVLPVDMNESAKDLILGLLDKNPEQRYGWEQIRSHPFLALLDWSAVESKRYKPSYIPVVTNPEEPTNFDSGFTREPPIDSVCTSDNSLKFSGFSFSEFPIPPTPADPVFDAKLIACLAQST